mgnify:CR=1 FL=1
MKRIAIYIVGLILVFANATGQLFAQNKVVKDSLVYLQPKEEHPIEMQYILSLLNRFHYRSAALNDSTSSDVFDQFIESLDPSRLYFLDSDIAYFERYRYKIDDDFRAGKLEFPYQIFHVRRERAVNRLNFIVSLLEDEMDFDDSEKYYFDRSEAEWAKGKTEWDNLWRKYLKNQALIYKLQGKEWKEIASSLTKRYGRWRKAIYQNKTEDVFQTYMNALTSTFDPHTDYFSPKAADDFNIQMSLSLEGIGARLSQNLDYTEIVEVVVGGPAYKSQQVDEKDRIVGVGQKDKEIVDVVGWRVDDVVQLIRGKKGTEVTLLLSKAGSAVTDAPDTVRLIRDTIKLEDQAATAEIIPITENGTTFKLGVINIPKFYRNFNDARMGVKDFKSTTRDVKHLIDSLKGEGMDALMVDLRFNGGGSLQEAVELTGLFIENGPVVQVKNSDKSIEKYRDTDGGVYYDGPMAVLINRFSASASEIFSGALQDYQRGIVLGETSYGKGTVQNIIDLNRVIDDPDKRMGQLKLTLAKFYRVTGSSTQHQGVSPDIQFPNIYSAEEYGESSQETALPWDKISSADFSPTGEISKDMIRQLAKLYKNDLETDPQLKKLIEDIAKANDEKERKYVSLNYQERKEERDAEKEEKDPLSTSINSELGSGNDFDINKNEKLKDDPYLKEGLKLLIALTKMQVG